MEKYSIGVDFGTLSARAVLVCIRSGRELASCEYVYPDGILTRTLPGREEPLPPGFALQNPMNYADGLTHLLKAVLRESGVNPASVVGIGVDATATTMLPVDESYRPLCLDPRYRESPHSWMKMWKHHSAQPQADRMNLIAKRRQEEFLRRCGGRISAEWMFPKVYETLEHAPDVYDGAHRLLEVADWLVYLLTGVEARNSCMAGFKAMWSPRTGYPSEAFFDAVDPRLAHVVAKKMCGPVVSIGERAGGLTEEMAAKTGLLSGTAVGVANTDGHHVLPAVGISGPNEMGIILGTSICHMVAHDKEVLLPGVGSIVEDGLLPGYFGYETGQPAAGDMLAWLVEKMLPHPGDGVSTYDLLAEKAALLPPGANGLLVLDWWNGNRSILADMELSGLIVGLNLHTKPEEIYRAMLEAMAFGTRLIVENYRNHGIPIRRLCACGGLSQKSPLTMQIFADVLGMSISVSQSAQTPALGAAMYGACAADKAAGGLDSIFDAAKKMARLQPEAYRPNPENKLRYDQLYAKYAWIYDLFGKGDNKLMAFLKNFYKAE